FASSSAMTWPGSSVPPLVTTKLAMALSRSAAARTKGPGTLAISSSGPPVSACSPSVTRCAPQTTGRAGVSHGCSAARVASAARVRFAAEDEEPVHRVGAVDDALLGALDAAEQIVRLQALGPHRGVDAARVAAAAPDQFERAAGPPRRRHLPGRDAGDAGDAH